MDFVRSTSIELNLWPVEHFCPPFFSTSPLMWKKVFNWSDVHFYRSNFYKIHILVKKVKKYPPCNPFLSRLMRSGYLARSCSDRSILMAPLMPRTPPTNIPLTLTLEAEELSPVKELLLLDRPIASIGLLLSGKSLKDCVLLAAIFQSYISIKQIQCSMRCASLLCHLRSFQYIT